VAAFGEVFLDHRVSIMWNFTWLRSRALNSLFVGQFCELGGMTMDARPRVVIDGDSHWYEPATMWRDYSAKADQDSALVVDHDDLGYPWVYLQGTALNLPAFYSEPTGGQDFTMTGKNALRWRAGLPSLRSYTDMPDDYWLAEARVESLDKWGIDEQVLFPQWGFQMEFRLSDQPEILRTNMEAWNRYAVDLVKASGGRLHPAGHIRLSNDPAWIRQQFAVLSEGGVRLVLCVPGLIGGRRMSHPDRDWLWAAFIEFGLTPAWHINQQMTRVFDHADAWTDNDDGEGIFKMVINPLTRTAAEIGLIDMAVNGVFHRHPDLKIVTAEIGASWFPTLCYRLDQIYNTNQQLSGRSFNSDLDRSPSEYLKKAVTLICSFPTDASAEEMEELREFAAFGGDYPHPEGLGSPFNDYQAILGTLKEETSRKIYGDNLGSILHGHAIRPLASTSSG
jgi:predicted TIM-barrel fold metal-dependent hydrolase